MKRILYVALTIFFLVISVHKTKSQSIGTGGGFHTIVSDDNGIVNTWGRNTYGQLGNNSTTNSSVPVAVYTSGVLSGKTITSVAAGYSHSIALASDGTVYTWGRNTYGQLGNNSTTDSSVPVAVNTSGVLSGKTITSVAGGYYHSIALASDGTVYTWGRNFYGQLGDNSTTDSSVPVAVNTSGVLSGKTITFVAAGYSHSIALASDGTVYTWGRNSAGQLGNNSTTDSSVPVAVNTSGVLFGKTITSVAAGYYHSIVLASDGTVYTWGDNTFGQLGNNSTTNSSVPVAVYTSGVLSGKTITSVAAGYYHSIVLASDGTVYTCGDNAYGQLGNNSTTDSSVPVAVYTSGVLSGKIITSVAGGYSHSIALASDWTVYTWGRNGAGQLGNGSTTDSHIPVEVNIVLPVELTSFTAKLVGKRILLNWQTATEVDNYGFDVERTAPLNPPKGGKYGDWVTLGFVEGHGNSNSPKEYSYTDNYTQYGKYAYRLKQIDTDGQFEYSEIVEVDAGAIPNGFVLEQNYPNPFNPSTTIKFALAETQQAELKVFDVLGNEVATLFNGIADGGKIYEVEFSAKDGSASGVYFYRLESKNRVENRKMLLLK